MANSDTVPTAAPSHPVHPDAPTLFRSPSFWGLTITQFLGAFNDNLFKQTLLLLFVAIPVADGTRDLQWLGTLMFAAPFILFSGYAGYLSDRNSKRRVIVLSKLAEIAVMAIGTLIFILHASQGLSVTVVTLLTASLFAMGTQSAFFGPGKYGILPELFRNRDLPQANGLILMTTFLAIIFGAALAGLLLETFPSRLWWIGGTSVLIACLGTATALPIRKVGPASPELPFDPSTLTIPRAMRSHLRADRPLLRAVIVSSIFWMCAAVVQMAVISLGKLQLGQSEFRTSLMAAAVSIGIAVGSVLAGNLSGHRFNVRVMKAGLWGMLSIAFLLSLPGWGDRPHLLGYLGSIAALMGLGFATGLFAVPLQVFMQSRPPSQLRGQMIATQNLLNWLGIAASSGVYWLGKQLIINSPSLLGRPLPESTMFAITGLLLLVVALNYHPREDE